MQGMMGKRPGVGFGVCVWENQCWENQRQPRGCPVPQNREQEAWMMGEVTSEAVKGREKWPVTDSLLLKLGRWSMGLFPKLSLE